MDKEKYVHQVFESIADGYDAANNRISLGMHMIWKHYAVKKLCENEPADSKYLDLCCGTGDMSELIIKYSPNCIVTGLDFSFNMLQLARKRLGNNSNAVFVEGNAMSLPFENDSFNGSIISFALRNTADYEKVISEMARVTKSNGRICIIDSFVPTSAVIRPFYNLYFSKIMPLIGGGIIRQNEYKWLNKSTEQFISPKQLNKLLEKYMTVENKKSFMFGSCVCIYGKKV